jgi:hypothetical protein
MSLQIKSSLIKLNALVFTCAFMFNAQAGTLSSTLDLNPMDPDIFSQFISTSYVGDATSGDFTAEGFAAQLINNAPAEAIDGGTFLITADIEKTNNIANGVLDIGGTIASLGFNSGTLLTATLAQIGGPMQTLNFLFNVTGGDAAGLYGGVGATMGVIMNFSGYNGLSSFDAAFSSDPFGANSDTVAVPVPSTVALFLIGFGALALRRNLRV